MEAYYNDAKTCILVVLEDGATEEFTVEEFIDTYGEDALPDSGSPVYKHEPPSPRIYWNAAIDLINAWSEYQAKKKLYINATHAETINRVRHVVVKNYDGNIRKVADHRNQLSEEVDNQLARFEDICAGFDVEPVNRVWLYRNLTEARQYASLREKCRRRLTRVRPAVALSKI